MGYRWLLVVFLCTAICAPASHGQENRDACRKEIVGFCPSSNSIGKFGVACVRNLSLESITQPCRDYLGYLQTKLAEKQARRNGREHLVAKTTPLLQETGQLPSMPSLAQEDAMDPGQAMMILIFVGVFFFLLLAAMWKITAKMGLPGYYGLIPVFGWYCWLKAMGKPLWWLLAMMVPVVGILFSGIFTIAIAQAFGKSRLYGIILSIFPPLFIKLAFDGSKFLAPTDTKPTISMAAALSKAG